MEFLSANITAEFSENILNTMNTMLNGGHLYIYKTSTNSINLYVKLTVCLHRHTDYIYVYAVLWGVLYVNLSYIIKKNAYSEDLLVCTYNSYIRKSLEAQMMPTIYLEKYLYRVFLIEKTTMHIDERHVKIKKN